MKVKQFFLFLQIRGTRTYPIVEFWRYVISLKLLIALVASLPSSMWTFVSLCWRSHGKDLLKESVYVWFVPWTLMVTAPIMALYDPLYELGTSLAVVEKSWSDDVGFEIFLNSSLFHMPSDNFDRRIRIVSDLTWWRP